jgi:hypothetical protein
MERNSATSETNKDHPRTALSFLIKNDNKPPISGTKNNNKTIICPVPLKGELRF